jgi:hypothetical protein
MENYSGDVIHPKGTGPQPIAVLARWTSLLAAFWGGWFILKPYPQGVGLLGPILGPVLTFAILFVPCALIPSFSKRHTTGFWRSLNEGIVVLALVFALVLYLGWGATQPEFLSYLSSLLPG